MTGNHRGMELPGPTKAEQAVKQLGWRPSRPGELLWCLTEGGLPTDGKGWRVALYVCEHVTREPITHVVYMQAHPRRKAPAEVVVRDFLTYPRSIPSFLDTAYEMYSRKKAALRDWAGPLDG